MRRTGSAFIALLALGCEAGHAPGAGLLDAASSETADLGGGPDAIASVDAAEASFDASTFDAAAPEGPSFEPGAVITCDTSTTAEILRPSCADPSLRIPVPSEVATVLDLSAFAPGHPDTCGPYFERPLEGGLLLPLEPAAYPIQIILPAVGGADPGCEACWPGSTNPLFGDAPVTAFGVALETHHPDRGRSLIGGDSRRMLAVSVPPPWYVVSGGGGEAYAWPCISGYQEFGIRSCITLPYGAFGFATVVPDAPSVSAILTLVETADGLDYWEPEYASAGCLYRGAD